MGKYNVGVRLKDWAGDEVEIIGKRKGERQIKWDKEHCSQDVWVGKGWVKDRLTIIPPANDNAAEWVPKVGDRVRVKSNNNIFRSGTPAGCEGTITRVYGDSGVELNLEHPRDGGIGQTCSAPQKYLEPLPVAEQPAGEVEREAAGGGFKAGDRIRLIADPYSIDALGSEFVAVARTSGATESVHFTDSDGEVTWRPGEYFELVTPTTDTWPPVVGKYGKTRDGRKVGPMIKDEWGLRDKSRTITGQSWNADGSFIAGTVSNLDLVAEWVDEPAKEKPVVAPATAGWKLTDAKPGDVVRCEEWGGGFFTAGKTYVIEAGGIRTNKGELYTLSNIGSCGGEFSLVEPTAPPAKFKVGDPVVALVSFNTVRKGEVRAITGVNSGGVYLDALTGGEPCSFFTFDEVAPAPSAPFARDSLVTLAEPVRVTGTIGKNAHVVIAGGSYTLPAAALVAA